MEKISLVEFLKFDKLDLKGKVFCFPTDTVYGVGCLFYDNIAIDKIYTMKKRSKDKPMANLCSSISQIESLNIPIPSKAKELMKTYWPGALTIILQDKMQTISFRMPDSLIALSMIEKFFILPTTSVNESGEKELNSYEDINEVFGKDIDYFISDKQEFSSIPSTVVDATKDLKVLRQGKIKI